MKNLNLLLTLVLCLIMTSCNNDDNNETPIDLSDVTLENYPRMDGSTSLEPLNRMIACKVLNYYYQWKKPYMYGDPWVLNTELPTNFLNEKIKTSQTHNSFINLIDDKADIILTARKMSPDERAYASEAGVQLIEKTIALDALVFLCNKNNPVSNLSIKQIQDIYAGKIVNWAEVGGLDKRIEPYVRNANSGSQELMESIVMKDIPIWNWAEQDPQLEIPTMIGVFTAIQLNENGLWYTVHYYKEFIIRNDEPSLAVNGISPTTESIRNKTYPFVSEVYAVIRSDLNQESTAYKMFQFITSTAAKDIINDSGYVSIY